MAGSTSVAPEIQRINALRRRSPDDVVVIERPPHNVVAEHRAPDDVLAVEHADEGVAPDDVGRPGTLVTPHDIVAPDDVVAPHDVVSRVDGVAPYEIVVLVERSAREVVDVAVAPDDVLRPGGLIDVDERRTGGDVRPPDD